MYVVRCGAPPACNSVPEESRLFSQVLDLSSSEGLCRLATPENQPRDPLFLSLVFTWLCAAAAVAVAADAVADSPFHDIRLF